jgi:flagellar hook protein FlgE
VLRSFNSGVTGIRNHQTRIDVIGNNIANVNTSGYKAQRAEFQDLVSQTIREGTLPAGGRGGTNAVQVGLGINTGAITSINTQGALQFTGKSTDLALQGEGYFIVNDGKQEYYTRDGAFDFDRQGTFMRPANGMKVQGWMAVNGKIDNAAKPTDITITRGMSLQPNPTTFVTLKGNLKSDAQDIVIDGVLKTDAAAQAGNKGTPVDIGLKLLTTKNEIIKGKLSFEQLPSTLTWSVKYEVDATDAGKIAGNSTRDLGTITFDSAGKMISNTLTNLSLQFKPENGAAAIDTAIIPSQLTMRPDIPDSRIGVGGSNQFPLATGLKGQVMAGTFTMTTNFYDSLGNAHAGNLIFSRDLDQQQADANTPGSTTNWRVSFSHSDPSIRYDSQTPPGAGVGPAPIEIGTIKFDRSGLLIDSNLSVLNIKYINGAADSQLIFNPGKRGEMTGLTQFTTSSTALVEDQDGYTSGTLQGFSVDDRGIVSGVFTNGQIRQLAQVAVATFNNPQGLVRAGGNLLTRGNNSGDAQIGAPASGGRAQVAASNLENSNVDLADSFANLITSQRGFQANSRIITTSDELLQELLQLKR